MKTKAYLILFSLLLCCISIQGTFSGDKIKLKLTQPPPNKMPVTSLWKMDIENTTREAITIYLSGTASGDRQGDIVGGTTKPFSVKPGQSTYGYDDFKSGGVDWKNRSIQEVIIRTGDVPEDNYTICMTAYYENGQIAEQQQCITHFVGPGGEGMITLVSPGDEEEINAVERINFAWSAVGIDGPYEFIIKEVKKGQSKEEAFDKNREIYKKDKIPSVFFQYPIEAEKLVEGKQYVWRVKAGEISSEIQAFVIESKNSYSHLVFSPEPCSQGCCFKISISGNTTSPFNGFKIVSSDNSITSVNLITGYSILNQSSGEMAIAKDIGTFSAGAQVGTICFQKVSNSFPVTIYWSTNSGVPYDMSAGDIDHITLWCSCTKCECQTGVHFAPLSVKIGDKDPITVNCGSTIAEPIQAGISITVTTSYVCPTDCLSPPQFYCGVTNTLTGEKILTSAGLPCTFIAPTEASYAAGFGVHCSPTSGRCDTCVMRFSTTCKTKSLVINTGYNFSLNTSLSIGSMDESWSAFAVSPFGWAPQLDKSQWISPDPSRYSQSTDYVLIDTFCLENLNVAPKIEFDYRVDNSATIVLNNQAILGSGATDNFQGAPKHVLIDQVSLFRQGVNTLTVVIHNEFFNGHPTVTGLNLSGTVTGNLFLPSCPCCFCGNWNTNVPKPIILSFNNLTELQMQCGGSYKYPNAKKIISVRMDPLAYICATTDCTARYSWVILRKKKNSPSWQTVNTGNGDRADYPFDRKRKYKVIFTAWCGINNCGTCEVTLGNAP